METSSVTKAQPKQPPTTTLSFLPLVLLAALLFSLAALIFWLQLSDRNKAAKLTLLQPETVNTIAIEPLLAESPTSTITRLSRNAEGWTLSHSRVSSTGEALAGEEMPANADRIAPILGLLQLPQRDNYPVDTIDLAELGLKPAKVRVEINNIEFLFGDKTLDGGARYVQIDDRVHLYQEFVYPLLTSGPNVFLTTPN